MHANLFHLGHLHLPIFSAFFAVGLILALLITQRTAPLAGIAPDAMWDASIFTAIAAFLISRLLLILTNLRSFLTYPILILTLPSLTVSGLLLTAIASYLYLRRHRLPASRVLDAAAPALALLWATLSLGSFVTGSTGMPTHLAWAIPDTLLGSIHPVEVYTSLAALALTVLLYRALALTQAKAPGTTAATGLFLAGTLAFLLDFLAQPSEADRIVLLDPVQWLALAMLLAGTIILLPKLQSR